MAPGVSGGDARAPAAGLLASVLSGSWRDAPPAHGLTAGDLERASPLLLGSGAGALAWWRIRRSALSGSAAAHALRAAYHGQTLQHALQERDVEYVFGLLRSRGVEPILLKGWAAAGLYPERGLRPTGDLDLCVRPDRRAEAKAVRWEPGRRGRGIVDFDHDPAHLLGGGTWDDLYARSRLVALNDTRVRVLGPADQLRFLCVHLLRHSAYRPLWLCDVAAAAERAREGFDWRVALGGGARERNWVCCALDLARRLLGASLDRAPAEARAFRAPAWLVGEVLKQWERPCTAERRPRELLAVSLRRPAGALPALLARWPDPIRASVGLGLPLDESPRLPRQVGLYLAQSAAYLGRRLR